MNRFRLAAVGLVAASILAACDGSGGHNVPDEANQPANGPDSASAGTASSGTLPPAGTVNPAAPSGPGYDPATDSTGRLGAPTPSGATGPLPNTPQQ